VKAAAAVVVYIAKYNNICFYEAVSECEISSKSFLAYFEPPPPNQSREHF